MQQDDEHARSKPAGTLGGSAAAPTSRAGGTRECRETLEAGAVGMARAHLAVMLARPLLEGAALYPAAMARLYLPYISPISPLYLPLPRGNGAPISPLYLPYISLYPAAMARLRVAKEQAAQARPARAGSAIARGWP